MNNRNGWQSLTPEQREAARAKAKQTREEKQAWLEAVSQRHCALVKRITRPHAVVYVCPHRWIQIGEDDAD